VFLRYWYPRYYYSSFNCHGDRILRSFFEEVNLHFDKGGEKVMAYDGAVAGGWNCGCGIAIVVVIILLLIAMGIVF
jgi:hypothetical protein